MTTIAYKDGILAFDSRITGGSTIHGWMTKGITTKTHIVAAAGAAQDIQAFFDWFEAGGLQADKTKFGLVDREVDIVALAVDKKGKVTIYEDRVYPTQIDSLFYAAGSGGDVALGALGAGASAVEAVRIAAKFDSATGGPIRTLKLDDLPLTKNKRKKKN